MFLLLFLNYLLILFNSFSYFRKFNQTVELVMSVGTATKEAKVEIDSHPVTHEAKLSKFSI